MVNRILLIIISLTLMILIQCKLNPEKVVLAINCGGPSFTSEEGIKYSKDKYFDGGVVSDHGLNYDIAGTHDMDLYQTERWSSDTLTYSLPMKEPGKYVLILKFSEVYFTNTNEKIFDVSIGKKIVIKGLDIFAKVGKATAHDEYIPFEISNDRVIIENKEVSGGYDAKTKELKLRLLKGPKDNPKINAIIVYKGKLEETEYSEKKKRVDAVTNQRMQVERKKHRLEQRHHADEVYIEDDLLNEDLSSFQGNDNNGLASIFMSKEGMSIWLSFGFFLVLNHFIDFIC